jgi:hypothetical protein
VHDVLVAIDFGTRAYLSPYLIPVGDPFKISLAVVAALLTIVAFRSTTRSSFDAPAGSWQEPDLTPETLIGASIKR